MSRSKSALAVRFKSTKLCLDQLEARMLCAVDTALNHLEELNGQPQVGANVQAPPTVGTAPTVARAVAITGNVQSIVRTASLSVLGRDNNPESLLTYRWSATSTTSGAAATFSTNNSNAAKNTNITFNRAGTYDVRVTITDRNNLSVTSSLRINVRQVLTTIELTPGTPSVAANATQQFTARGRDQFSQVMATNPTFTWSATAGTIGTTGLYRAPTTTGSATITVRSGSISATTRATITATSPTPSPTPNPSPTPSSDLQNTAIRNLVTSYTADSSISRTEMIALLRSAGNDGTVDSTELADLRTIVANPSRFGIADYVKTLAGNVVNTNTANANYRGAAAGNLAVGSSATLLNNLVDKWFMGTDLPTLDSGSLQYRTVAGSLFNGAPSTANMKQGALGDCYFISALGALADRNTDAVRNMFIDNGDGTFTVRFFFGSYAMGYNTDGSISTGFRSGTTATADYITVNRSLATYSSGGLAYSGSGWSSTDANNSLWIALAEKAYAQWNETGRAGRDVAANTYASIEGGWMGEVSAQVLGYNVTEYVLANSQQSHLTNALAANRAVTIGTKGGATIGGLVGGHAYVVSGYNASNNTFTLLNPWGNTHPRALTWSELQTACDWFSVANPSNSTPITQTVRGTGVRSGNADAVGTPVILMVEVKLTPTSVSTESSSSESTEEDTYFSQVADFDSSEDVSLNEVLDSVAIEANADEALAAMDAALSSENLDEILAIEFSV